MATATKERDNGTPGYAPIPNGRLMPKVEKYHWTTKNTPGKFMVLAKHLLNIDHRYQRTRISPTKVAGIRSEWDWVALGCLIVILRTDGTYWVVDGQHRKLAADDRTDIEHLPCLVFNACDLKGEADGYLQANTFRSPLQMLDKFNAMLIRGDATAIRVKTAVDEAGLTFGAITHNPKSVACIKALLVLFSDAKAADELWPIVLAMSVQKEQRMQGDVILALVELRQKLLKSECDQSISERHNAERLIEMGMDGCAKEAAKASGYFGKGGAKIAAQGIVNALNHRRTSRRLPTLFEA